MIQIKIKTKEIIHYMLAVHSMLVCVERWFPAVFVMSISDVLMNATRFPRSSRRALLLDAGL